MRIGGPLKSPLVRRAGIVHGVITVIAYAIGVAWLIITSVGPVNLGFVFLEVWFLAVIMGAYATSVAYEG